MGAQSDPSSGPWQDQLKHVCQFQRIQYPTFQDYSDRRGGRTAWSSAVTVGDTVHSSRFWYDGKNIKNAREDAAECAVKYLTGSESGSPTRSHGY